MLLRFESSFFDFLFLLSVSSTVAGTDMKLVQCGEKERQCGPDTWLCLYKLNVIGYLRQKVRSDWFDDLSYAKLRPYARLRVKSTIQHFDVKSMIWLWGSLPYSQFDDLNLTLLQDRRRKGEFFFSGVIGQFDDEPTRRNVWFGIWVYNRFNCDFG